MASMKSLFKTKVNELTKKIKKINNGAVTEVETNKLPKPVKRFLKYAHVIGKEHSKYIHMKSIGKIRLKPEDGWIQLKVEQVNYLTKPSRLVHLSGSKWGIVGVSGFDKYETAKTERVMKLLSFINIPCPEGEGTIPTAMISFLSDMALFPSALLNKYIEWENIDNLSAKAIIKEQQFSASAILHFNEQDQLVSIESDDCYYSADGVKLEKAKWSISYSEYKEINGFMIPTATKEKWHLPNGQFDSAEYQLKDIQINVL